MVNDELSGKGRPEEQDPQAYAKRRTYEADERTLRKNLYVQALFDSLVGNFGDGDHIATVEISEGKQEDLTVGELRALLDALMKYFEKPGEAKDNLMKRYGDFYDRIMSDKTLEMIEGQPDREMSEGEVRQLAEQNSESAKDLAQAVVDALRTEVIEEVLSEERIEERGKNKLRDEAERLVKTVEEEEMSDQNS